MSRWRSCLAVACVAVAAATSACSDDPAAPEGDPLAGLTVATRGDTAPEPPSDTPPGPGYFTGTVYGYDQARDTIESAVRLDGLRVTAYTRAESDGQVVAGRQVATVLTNAQGAFQLPTLPGGEYVVSFVPPAASPYRGGWTTAGAWQQSGDNPWFIMLQKR